MSRLFFALAISCLLAVHALSAAAQSAGPAMGRVEANSLSYRAEDFPVLRESLHGFDEALRSPENGLRYHLQWVVARLLPHPEAERLLRCMLKDPARPVGEQAAQALVAWGFPLPAGERPLHFGDLDAVPPEALEDRLCAVRDRLDKPQDPKTDRGGAANGEWAVALGLYGGAEDLPRVRRLAAHENVYVRFCAAKALLYLADAAGGRAALASVVAGGDPYYIAHARFLLERLDAPAGWDPCRAWTAIFKALKENEGKGSNEVFMSGDPEAEWQAVRREGVIPKPRDPSGTDRGER